MNLKYDSYLFSELVYMYIIKNDQEIFNELSDRMNFCGFDKKMIESFIDLEKLLVKHRDIKYDKPLYDKFYWFKAEKTLFEKDYESIFMINSHLVTEMTLTFADAISMLDEATYMLMLKSNLDSNLKNELLLFAEIDKVSFVRKEIAYRFMLCYDKVKDDNSEMPEIYFKCVNKFINNELRIINLCKWIYPGDRQNGISINWKPYTSEYYKYYD